MSLKPESGPSIYNAPHRGPFVPLISSGRRAHLCAVVWFGIRKSTLGLAIYIAPHFSSSSPTSCAAEKNLGNGFVPSACTHIEIHDELLQAVTLGLQFSVTECF